MCRWHQDGGATRSQLVIGGVLSPKINERSPVPTRAKFGTASLLINSRGTFGAGIRLRFRREIPRPGSSLRSCSSSTTRTRRPRRSGIWISPSGSSVKSRRNPHLSVPSNRGKPSRRKEIGATEHDKGLPPACCCCTISTTEFRQQITPLVLLGRGVMTGFCATAVITVLPGRPTIVYILFCNPDPHVALKIDPATVGFRMVRSF